MESENNEVENYPLEESLNQRSYLLDILVKLFPEYKTHLWDFTGTITYKQYRRLLALFYSKQYDEIKAAVEEYLKSLNEPKNI